ncbi:hypothetical protein CRUP_018079 [Coryphaenoides rupestris]|nr:hypothetical protein CRUP_018079 [Coryphaenoides rupestris]
MLRGGVPRLPYGDVGVAAERKRTEMLVLQSGRFSEDSASALSPPSAHSLSPSPISLSQPALSPSPTPSSQYQNWVRSTSPQPPAAVVASQPPRSHSPLSPTTYAPYPTSPKHRPVYRTKALEFQFIPSRESRKADSHILQQRRRAPSPLISPSERPKVGAGPPRPSSLPLLPTTPLYSALYDLRSGAVTPPSPGNPLGDPYFSPSPPPLFAPSGAPPLPPNSTLVVSRSLSPTHFLSGTSSPPMHPCPPPTCLSYPHLPPPPPPAKPFAAKPLPYWTKYDVADWLAYLNLAEHRDRFLDNEIDGTHLPSLTKEDYLDLGVTRVGHRMNIERALRRVVDRMSSTARTGGERTGAWAKGPTARRDTYRDNGVVDEGGGGGRRPEDGGGVTGVWVVVVVVEVEVTLGCFEALPANTSGPDTATDHEETREIHERTERRLSRDWVPVERSGAEWSGVERSGAEWSLKAPHRCYHQLFAERGSAEN